MTTAASVRPPAARLRLGARPGQGGTVRRIDGAWWPRSYDLAAELPVLLAALPHGWGDITSVLVNGAMWSLDGDGTPIEDQRVRMRRAGRPRAEHTVCLLASGHGRWDLLVVPPAATAEEAEGLMEGAASDPPLAGRPA